MDCPHCKAVLGNGIENKRTEIGEGYETPVDIKFMLDGGDYSFVTNCKCGNCGEMFSFIKMDTEDERSLIVEIYKSKLKSSNQV